MIIIHRSQMHNIVYMEMKQKTKQNKSSRRSKHLTIRVDYVSTTFSHQDNISLYIIII